MSAQLKQSVLKSIFSLIRIPNLFILALVMYMVRLMLVEPLLILSHNAPAISSLNFFIIVLSTVMIAAGGYIINDIEDMDIDLLNERVNVFNIGSITKETGYNIYLILNFIAICLGFYLTLKCKVPYVAYANLISAGLLYFYSTTYKRQFLIGNFIVSILTSFCLAIVYLTEHEASHIDSLKYLCTGYVVFAFLLSMARELIKDIEDKPGDEKAGCKTFPIVVGITVSKILVSIFILLILILLIYIQIVSHQWESQIPFLYVAVFIEIPLLILLVSLFISSNKDDYKRCSSIAKFIMLTGILSMPVFFYTF